MVTPDNELKIRHQRAKKMMLWFGIVSMAMMFAGLTSAYVVSKTRPDWLNDFQLPVAFTVSTIIIVLSSLSLWLASRFLNQNQIKKAALFTLLTLLLAIGFGAAQFSGFSQVIEMGYFFTGPQSSVTTSFLYIIAIAHLTHAAAGIITLIVVLYKLINHKYDAQNRLGFDLAQTFWHFVDILWIYLFVFLYYFG